METYWHKFPPELQWEVLAVTVRARGIRRAVRLRLVSRDFDSAVVHALFDSDLILEAFAAAPDDDDVLSGRLACPSSGTTRSVLLDRYVNFSVISRRGPPPTVQLRACSPCALCELDRRSHCFDVRLHTLPEVTYSDYLKDGQEFRSLQNGTVRVRIEGKGKNGMIWFSDAKVIDANVLTHNGLVHVLDAVIVPLEAMNSGASATPLSTRPRHLRRGRRRERGRAQQRVWLQVNYDLSHQAIPQGAGDGSATVNYLHQFYTTARRTQTPSPIEACQFFAKIHMRSIILWARWREQGEDGSLAEGPNLVPAVEFPVSFLDSVVIEIGFHFLHFSCSERTAD
ncbi:hypothetical protein DM02DRAFT_733863 [Periconia macrospinosa]|uniref:FAS1 domain-containing protein n=1 Tax=Periconia macrospinosa TaxID=97972 RepID=A0A2V1D2A2_9PLEO|nr:hypothetical protein DM02DRAFT_733863 [Periconia macrospinosa]